MGLLDVFRSIFSGASSAYPEPIAPSPQVQKEQRAALAAAEGSGSYDDIMRAISDLDSNAWLWDECEAAWVERFDSAFPCDEYAGRIATLRAKFAS